MHFASFNLSYLVLSAEMANDATVLRLLSYASYLCPDKSRSRYRQSLLVTPLLVLLTIQFSFECRSVRLLSFRCEYIYIYYHIYIYTRVSVNFVILNMKFILSVLAVFALVAYVSCGKARLLFGFLAFFLYFYSSFWCFFFVFTYLKQVLM